MQEEMPLARVPLIDPDRRPDLAPLTDRISGARRGRVINIYRALLGNPVLAETWFAHLNAVRWKTALDGRLREIVIIRVGHLTKAAYMLRQHVPKLAAAEGLTEPECAALADWQSSAYFDARERAALAYTDAVTRDADADDATFAAVAAQFEPTALVDLTVLIGTYNMLARFTNPLRLDLETD
jgi:alkylhydroperoxidase family enzyme